MCTPMQVMSGSARKRPGGPGQHKHCSWCGLMGHRNKKSNPCTNPPMEVTGKKLRAELEAAKAAKAKAERKKERHAAREARKSGTPQPGAAAAAAAQPPRPKPQTPATPPPAKVSPLRRPPTDRSSARAAQEAKREEARATIERETSMGQRLFDTDGTDVPDAEPEAKPEPEESPPKARQDTPRRSQRTAAEVEEPAGKDEVQVVGQRLRPGPTGNRASLLSTDDKRLELWNRTFRRIATAAGTCHDVPGDGWCWVYSVMMSLALPMKLPTEDELVKRSKMVVKLMKVHKPFVDRTCLCTYR
jgi:hypothetical protein